MLSIMLAGVFFLLCAFACLKDATSLTIPNWVNIGIVLAFVPAAIVGLITLDTVTFATIGWHIAVAFITFVVCFLLFCFNAFGGGDAKLIPAIALWVGPTGLMHFLAGTAISGGVVALAVLLVRSTVPEPFAPGFVRAREEGGKGVPYGVAISAGAVVGGFGSPFLINFLSLFSHLN